MISKRIATLLAALAVAGASPAFSQATAAPAPAAETSFQGSAQAGESNVAAYIVAAVVFGGLIYGFIEFLDDDEGGVSVSP